MSRIEPHELSAFLDGELPPERAREIEQALENDPALRAEFEALALDDASWRAIAASARFQPAVRLPVTARSPSQPLVTLPRLFALGALLTLAKLAPRLIETVGISFTLQGCVLVVLLCAVWVALKRETEASV